jgi:hypothetical protein
MGLFDKFFQLDHQEGAALLEKAQVADEIIAWSNMPYFKKHMDWLLDEATRPATISENHMEMVKSAVRANTLKEIRQHLERAIRAAEMALAETRGE